MNKPPTIDFKAIDDNCEKFDRLVGGSFAPTCVRENPDRKTQKPLPTDIVSLYAALQVSPYF